MNSKLPFSSRTVAYWLLARGQDDLLHNPVKLYSFLQNFCVFALEQIMILFTQVSTNRHQTNQNHQCLQHLNSKVNYFNGYTFTWIVNFLGLSQSACIQAYKSKIFCWTYKFMFFSFTRESTKIDIWQWNLSSQLDTCILKLNININKTTYILNVGLQKFKGK